MSAAAQHLVRVVVALLEAAQVLLTRGAITSAQAPCGDVAVTVGPEAGAVGGARSSGHRSSSVAPMPVPIVGQEPLGAAPGTTVVPLPPVVVVLCKCDLLPPALQPQVLALQRAVLAGLGLSARSGAVANTGDLALGASSEGAAFDADCNTAHPFVFQVVATSARRGTGLQDAQHALVAACCPAQTKTPP